MARKQTIDLKKPPQTLKDHPFYGFELDDDQIRFRDAIWNKNKLIVFCNARSGSGKTLLSVATADLMVKYGMYEGIVYIVAPVQESKLGYLPGDADTKIAPYCEPFYQAAYKIGLDVDRFVKSDIINVKEGTGYIELCSHTFLRGVNFENKVVIIDEAQNMYRDELKKVLTRCHDSCKTIVIGHTGQCDLHPSTRESSGFQVYIDHFKSQPFAEICSLTKNYRGLVSSWADRINM